MNRVELNMLIDSLISIKDKHKNILSLSEIDTINDACNLIEHNLDVLEDKMEKSIKIN